MVLKDKAAIVTGAGRGLGKAIAAAFVREGAHVMMMSLDETELEKAAEEIQGIETGSIITYAGNVSKESDVAHAVQETLTNFNALDILVNNAGIVGPPRFLEDTDITTWNITIGINLTGYFLFTRAALAHMIPKRHGKIINIVSGLGQMAFPRFCAYSVSKAGDIQLTRSIASEVETCGIQVNAIDPGLMDTAMHETIREMGPVILGQEVYRQFMEYKAKNILKKPDDVATLAVFLASAASNHITGQIGTMKCYRQLGWTQ